MKTKEEGTKRKKFSNQPKRKAEKIPPSTFRWAFRNRNRKERRGDRAKKETVCGRRELGKCKTKMTGNKRNYKRRADNHERVWDLDPLLTEEKKECKLAYTKER